MIQAPTAHVDAAMPHPAAARAGHSATSEFESLLAGYNGAGSQDEALPDTSGGLDDAAPREERKARPEASQPPNQGKDDPTEKLLKAREVATEPAAWQLERQERLERTAARLEAARTSTGQVEANAETAERLARTGEHPKAGSGQNGQQDAARFSTKAQGHADVGASAVVADDVAAAPLAARASLPSTAVKDPQGKSPRLPQRAGPAAQSLPSDDGASAGPGERGDITQSRDWPDTARAELKAVRGGARAAPDAAMVDPKPLGSIALTRRETHFAPVRQPAAIEEHHWRRQLLPEPKVATRTDPLHKATFAIVTDQLSQALDSARGEAEAKLQQATQQAAPGARPLTPVKIVELSLQPASLGALAITMRLTGAGLRVTVSATSRETADLLREDREALAALIDGAGYEANEIVVTHRPPPRSLPASA